MSTFPFAVRIWRALSNHEPTFFAERIWANARDITPSGFIGHRLDLLPAGAVIETADGDDEEHTAADLYVVHDVTIRGEIHAAVFDTLAAARAEFAERVAVSEQVFGPVSHAWDHYVA